MQTQSCACSDPLIKKLFSVSLCHLPDFPSALASLLTEKLADRVVPAEDMRPLIENILKENPELSYIAAIDLMAVQERDPACPDLPTAFLFFKGWQALQAYRIAHQLWVQKRTPLAYQFQSRMNECFSIDIHPAARLGKAITIDHGTGVVIGETAIIEDNVSLFQNITIGGTGRELGERHPILKEGAMVGSGAILLGRITIGRHAKIGAASVVLNNIPDYATAVGNPARVIRLSPPQNAEGETK
ncbi:serine o-acetyltransferase [Lasius niger]|uniref:serine O-acetyltransferase n=1 Tax=Lasius niger TaxID=67767 RepID=A0A0J7K5F3_LASNI|nr:serine o-acetyltransferase [Lasius niger]